MTGQNEDTHLFFPPYLQPNRTHTHTLSDSGRKIFSLLYFREPRPDSSLPHSTKLDELLALNPRVGFRGQQIKILEIPLRSRVFLFRDGSRRYSDGTRAQQGDFRPNLGTRRIPERLGNTNPRRNRNREVTGHEKSQHNLHCGHGCDEKQNVCSHIGTLFLLLAA